MQAADLLADEQDALADDSDGDDDSTAEFLQHVFDTLDERGYLDMMMQQRLQGSQQATDSAQGDVPAVVDPNDSGGSDGSQDAAGGAQVDAEVVADFGKVVLDEFGDVPISQVVKFAENNPNTVNQAIQNALDGAGEA